MTRWPALLLVFCALALAPARADETPVCKGRDLSRSAEIKPDLAAHADELTDGDGLLWKIEKEGLAPSYFYGTIHSTQPTAVALARAAATYIEDAKAVATELGGPFDASEQVDLSAGMLRAALSPNADTIAEAIPAPEIGAVEAFVAAHGLPGTMAHHLKLWFLAVATALPACEAEGAREGLPEVDQLIAETGKARHLPIVALESVDEQLKTLSTTPNDLAAKLLRAGARLPQINDDGYATLLSLYLQKRPAFAIALLDAIPELTVDDRKAEMEFTRLLLVGRNELMLRRASPLLEQGGAFIAVGALHLSGRNGLVELARAAGYKVSKIW